MNDVRALLLTDVVDSTKLSEALGDAAMADVWAAHDRVARDLLPLHGGREIDKTDGMLLMFDEAARAVAYAQAYHRGIAALAVPLKARAGLHVGPVILRENSADDIARGAKPLELDGLTKPTAARVMSLALGGQTLLTAQAMQALDSSALQRADGPTLQAQSHGHWVMKGLSEPVELFEVAEAGSVFTAPPDGDKVHRVVQVDGRWLAVRQIPNNLPQQATPFLGREREIREVKTLLAKGRLVTLLGMGGLGKTRLSLQVAAELMHEFPDGVWFLDLSPIRDAALVVSEAAQVLGVQEEPGRALLQTVCAQLKTRRVLLVVDNCEHLIKPSADLCHALLRAALGVRILSSSREALRVPGEQAYPVLPLPVPRAGDDLATLSQSTAVQLFVTRAQSHKPAFELNQREAPAVAELVARLEGIPLALELAAARVRSLSVADINARLKDRYKILTGGSRVLQQRQQTLRALVDWSYELLTEGEQTLLGRLGVFAGGFDLAAAETVCGTDPIEDFEVLDILTSLVEKSLVMLDERDDGARYKMLETIRDYAREKLDLSGDAPATATRHCEHYFAVAKQAKRGLQGPEPAPWVERMEANLDNLRVAIALAQSGGADPLLAVKLPVAMMLFWMMRGYCTEGRNVVRASLAMPEVQAVDVAHSHALYVAACLAESQSDHAEARRMLEACLELRRRLGNPVDIAANLSTLSVSRLAAGDAEGARADEEEALRIFRRAGDRYGEAIGLLHLGQVALYVGDDAQALACLQPALAIARAIKQQELEGECELLLGGMAFEAGEPARAAAHFARSLSVCHEAGDRKGDASAQWWLGKADLQAGALASARSRLGEALRAFRAFEMHEGLLGCLEDHAALALAEGDAALAWRLATSAEMSRERLGLNRSPRSRARWTRLFAALQHTLDELSFDADQGALEGWEVDEAIRNALAPPTGLG